jgi:hypothetical protein
MTIKADRDDSDVMTSEHTWTNSSRRKAVQNSL